MQEGIVAGSPAADELMNVQIGDTADSSRSVITRVEVNASDINADLTMRVSDSYEEPMVIEFTRSGSGDGAIVRAGNKRARVNSDSSLREIIRQPFVKQPVTIYGIYFVFLLHWYLYCSGYHVSENSRLLV